MFPVVSVIIPSFNHEKFIAECIQSVLDQTFQDFEIIITDDGSSDRTVEIIENFNDSRIKLFKHTKNRGACVAANNCIAHASGRYIAMFSSDDVWYPKKLAIQVKYLDEHPEVGVVFGKVAWIDKSSNLITNVLMPNFNLFEVENRTRFEWLRYFFLAGNCLCHPCSLVRRECYEAVGIFDPAFASLPDLDFWIRICLRYDIKILDQKLTKFRKFSDESNASGYTNTTLIRNRFEHRQSLNHYLAINKTDDLVKIFPEAIEYGEVTEDIIPYFLSRIAIDTEEDYKVLWGLDTIFHMLQDEKLASAIEEKVNFTYLDFIELVSKHDIYKLSTFPSHTPPQGVHRSVTMRFLSLSKQYLKDIYKIMFKFQEI